MKWPMNFLCIFPSKVTLHHGVAGYTTHPESQMQVKNLLSQWRR